MIILMRNNAELQQEKEMMKSVYSEYYCKGLSIYLEISLSTSLQM